MTPARKATPPMMMKHVPTILGMTLSLWLTKFASPPNSRTLSRRSGLLISEISSRDSSADRTHPMRQAAIVCDQYEPNDAEQGACANGDQRRLQRAGCAGCPCRRHDTAHVTRLRCASPPPSGYLMLPAYRRAGQPSPGRNPGR